jgi:GNAT superfamily N-acetyltransferase
MTAIRIIDVRDEASFELVPPCADPAFDHRTCDYWEDAERGSKGHRASWLQPAAGSAPASAAGSDAGSAPGSAAGSAAGSVPGSTAASTAGGAPASRPAHLVDNPFAPPPKAGPAFNPFAIDEEDRLVDNPFAPPKPRPQRLEAGGPRKLALLGRGLAIFGSYAKVLLADDRPVAYAQFGPLSAYPRALRLRDLYPQLPQAPLPAVITCIATTAEARGQGHALRLVEAVCDDLAGRGFAAVEAYPEAGARPDATSAASPAFWIAAGFRLAVDDERFPVVRRELA